MIFISPAAYFALPTSHSRTGVGNAIARHNAVLPEKTFTGVGPGRRGSMNSDLGVFVSYADIHNAGALVELSGHAVGPAPEPSLGTHFSQDLMEAQIFPLAISLDHRSAVFNQEFFYKSPSCLRDWIEADDMTAGCLRRIDIQAERSGRQWRSS